MHPLFSRIIKKNHPLITILASMSSQLFAKRRRLSPMNQDHEEDNQASGHINSLNYFCGSRRQTEVFPAGVRFCPHDEELIFYYLKKKVDNQELPFDGIKDVNIYEHDPDYLTALYPALGDKPDKQWYFFTPRDRKYRNGTRPNRTTGGGYWKASGAANPVYLKGEVVGHKRALVFYQGKPQKGEKTNWIMHEFTVHGPPRLREGENDTRLDWVLCHIYKRETGRAKEAEELDTHMPTADDASLLASSVDENDLIIVESSRHDDAHIQSTQLPQISQSTHDFLTDHTSTAEQKIVNCETPAVEASHASFQHQDEVFFQWDESDAHWLADLDTSSWGFDNNCGLYPDDNRYFQNDDMGDFWADLPTTNVDASVGGFGADYGFNQDGLSAHEPSNLTGQNYDLFSSNYGTKN